MDNYVKSLEHQNDLLKQTLADTQRRLEFFEKCIWTNYRVTIFCVDSRIPRIVDFYPTVDEPRNDCTLEMYMELASQKLEVEQITIEATYGSLPFWFYKLNKQTTIAGKVDVSHEYIGNFVCFNRLIVPINRHNAHHFKTYSEFILELQKYLMIKKLLP